MALLKFGFVKNDNSLIYAPVEGEVVDLIKVRDPAIAQKNLGAGFAVAPTDNLVYAPVTGQIMMVATTQHAIGIRMANGLEVLLHLGLNTSLMPEGVFHIRVKRGQMVHGGQRIATANFNRMKVYGYDDTVVVTFINSEELNARFKIDYGPTSGSHRIGHVYL